MCIEAEFAAGHDCILVRDETSPEDVGGMWAAKGVLTARGGMTSHAAVVARGWYDDCHIVILSLILFIYASHHISMSHALISFLNVL